MKDLLSYHQRLVEEKGLPPSRLMEQHAAASASSNQSPGRKEKSVKCYQCDFSSVSQRGLKVHVRRSHKGQQADEILREDEEVEVTLNLSHVSREEYNLNMSKDQHSAETFTPFTFTCKDCEEEFTVQEYVEGYLFSMCCEKTKQLCQDCCYSIH